jgi:DMSO/TMAO reductase YedYZ heme-binding membrane subunit
VTTWIVLRAAGIGAYLLLFLSVAFGLVATTAPFGKRFAKASATTVHQFMSTVALILLAVHVGGLVLDTYLPFGPVQILVPGTSSYRSVPVGLGVIAMYAMVLVLVSSWLRKHYPVRVWRAIHLLAVPAFVLSMLHGIYAGADATRPWMYATYIASGVIVVFLLVLRGLVAGMRPIRRAQSSPRSGPPSSGAPEASAVGPREIPVDAGEGPPVVPRGATEGVASSEPGVGSVSRRSDVTGRSGGPTTRTALAGSVRLVPTTTKAPSISAAASAAPRTPHMITKMTRRIG